MSTRSLTLHWFAREDDPTGAPRVGLAIPRAVGSAVVRNRLKRKLREAWDELEVATGGRDYVLAARPGLADAAEARGHDWLVAELREVVGKVTS